MNTQVILFVLAVLVSQGMGSLVLDSFSNLSGDTNNQLFHGGILNVENNPVWKALRTGVQDRQIYQRLNVPEYMIDELLRARSRTLNMLEVYFRTYLISPFVLESAVKNYIGLLQQINQNYLKDVSNVAYGAGIEIKGLRNYVKSKNIQVHGFNNHIIDHKNLRQTFRGSEKIIIGRYMIDRKNIDKISQGPEQVIRILRPS